MSLNLAHIVDVTRVELDHSSELCDPNTSQKCTLPFSQIWTNDKFPSFVSLSSSLGLEAAKMNWKSKDTLAQFV